MALCPPLLLLLVTELAAAQPFWYLKNLDSPFVPTNQATVEAMPRVANVGANDYLIDLGSGDGRILITAARHYGVRGTGSEVYFWVVPAAVAGKWTSRIITPHAAQLLEIEFTQKFQEIEGSARRDGKLVHVRDVRLDGDRISFVLIDDADHFHRQHFEGRVNGKAMEGTVRGGGAAPRTQHNWRANRNPP